MATAKPRVNNTTRRATVPLQLGATRQLTACRRHLRQSSVELRVRPLWRTPIRDKALGNSNFQLRGSRGRAGHNDTPSESGKGPQDLELQSTYIPNSSGESHHDASQGAGAGRSLWQC
jgi:hypothetical protein